MSTRSGSWLGMLRVVVQRNAREAIESRAMQRQPGPDPDADEDQHQQQRDHADRMSPDLVHGACLAVTPRPCKYATSASSSVLSLVASYAAAMSASVYGSPSRRSTRMRAMTSA